ncbi:MAG: SDR family oxidoreductase [Caldilineaceae bacterium]|nr:SDR family oxidoreductase [Caldilineaceae bacterium]MBP8121054.1 SDR family oxidoreductase [Caldilineaceae bacterium]MBP9073792.1 SDR family oxidoreductase [Caldilineaceae bacterium]
MNLHLQNRVAAVAGASGGLGYACALTLAQEGCRVGICARRADKLAAAALAIRDATGAEVFAIALDMSEAGAPRRFIQSVAEHFGQLDMVVANAGGPPSGPFATMSDDQWRYAVDLNLLSTVSMFHEALPHVTASDQGRLIAITSISAKQPLENLVLSNATRAGVHGLVKTLSREIAATGTTVNAVCPGLTRTDRLTELAQQMADQQGITLEEAFAKRSAGVPLGRLGDPMEFGAAVAYLCSKQAAFISGVALPVDGGFLTGLP